MIFRRPTNLIPAKTNFRIRAVITNDNNLHAADFVGLFKFSVYLNDPADMLLMEDLITMSLRMLETPYDHDIGVPGEMIKVGRDQITLCSSFRPVVSGWEEGTDLIHRDVNIAGHLYNLNNGLIYAQADFVDVLS